MDMVITPSWTRAHWTLLFIILTPIAVVLLATFIYFSGWGLPDGTRNEGVLLTRPIDISRELSLVKQTEYFGKQTLNPWRFAVVIPSVCDKACEERLWFVKQVRVALGKYQGRVENAVLTLPSTTPLPMLDKYQLINRFQIDPTTLAEITRQHPIDPLQVSFYLVDPQGLVMMVYSQQHSYQQVIKDMKFLFKGVE